MQSPRQVLTSENIPPSTCTTTSSSFEACTTTSSSEACTTTRSSEACTTTSSSSEACAAPHEKDECETELKCVKDEWIDLVHPELAYRSREEDRPLVQWPRFSNLEPVTRASRPKYPLLPRLDQILYNRQTQRLSAFLASRRRAMFDDESEAYHEEYYPIITEVWINTEHLKDLIGNHRSELIGQDRNFLFTYLQDMLYAHQKCVLLLRAVREYLELLIDRLVHPCSGVSLDRHPTPPERSYITFELDQDSMIDSGAAPIYRAFIEDINYFIRTTVKTVACLNEATKLLEGAVRVDDYETWETVVSSLCDQRYGRSTEESVIEPPISREVQVEKLKEVMKKRDEVILFAIDMMSPETADVLTELRREIIETADELCTIYVEGSDERLAQELKERLVMQFNTVKEILAEYGLEI